MIVNNASLVTHWTSQPAISGALVAIEGKSIVDFGLVGKLVDRYDGDTEILDVAGRLVVPGMIDAGSRLYRSVASAIPLPWRDSHLVEVTTAARNVGLVEREKSCECGYRC